MAIAIASATVAVLAAIEFVVAPLEYQYPEGETLFLTGFYSNQSLVRSVCIQQGTVVSFTWTAGNAAHNATGVVPLGGPPFVASVELWPSGWSPAHPTYRATGSGGAGSYTSPGNETFAASNMPSWEAVSVALSWHAPGPWFQGPRSDLRC